MPCNHKRSPIDIKTSATNRHCDLKCTYMCQYKSSPVIITNKGDHLSIGDYYADKVIYNNIRVDDHITSHIFTPSVHSFNGVFYDAELIVLHKGNGSMVSVCIPISGIGSSNTSLSSILDSKYLDQVLLKNESVNPSGLEYNLADTIKINVPFFSYSSNLFFDNCDKCDYIVYNDPIIVSSTSISTLRNILSPHKIKLCTTNCPTLYYNKKGATDGKINGEIYIECQPTDHSGKEISVPVNQSLPDINQLTGIKLNLPMEHIMLGAISGIIIIFMLSKMPK